MADHTNVPTQTAQLSDMVTRLREHPVELLHCDCVRCEAADEIERLRDKVQDLRMHAEQDECEIERLRAALWLASEVALVEIADPANTSVDDVVLYFLKEAAQADKTKEARRG